MLTEAIVASVIAGSSVCSDHFENPNRFNPTALSDYQQCVLAAHSSQDAGTLGSIFWVKTGDVEFVSMPVKTLREAGSKAAAKEIVIETIIEEVVVEHIVTEYVDRIEYVERELTEQQRQAIEFSTNYITGVGSANSLDSDVQQWLYSRGIPYIGAPNAAAAWEAATNVTEKVTVLLTVAKALDATITNLPTPQQVIHQARQRVDQSDAAIDRAIAIEKNLARFAPDLTNYSQASGSGVNIWRDANGNYNLWDPRNPHVDPTGRELSHFLGRSINNSLETLVERAIESAYDAGYDEGYADGYADGFADGVASVRAQ